MTAADNIRRDHGVAMHELAISVIMPAYNAEAFLQQSLPPLVAMLKGGAISELIVVDDGSTDGSATIARELGAHVIPSGGRLGPGGARNVASTQAHGDIVWFVDSDVVATPNGPERIRAAFKDPGVWAVFGSYDDRPAAQNFGSQYNNLLHHHTHQQGQREASTFWAGCGAVRRDKLLAAGGFDAARFTKPSIEDIDLGYRLRDRGARIVLDKDLLSTHLKYWTVPEIVRVGVLRRALPWARLMLQRGGLDNDLNVSWKERLRAGLAGLLVLSIAAASSGIVPAWMALLLIICAIAANWPLFGTFARHRGVGFALLAIGFHQIYYLYSTASFLWCWLEHKLSPRRT